MNPTALAHPPRYCSTDCESWKPSPSRNPCRLLPRSRTHWICTRTACTESWRNWSRLATCNAIARAAGFGVQINNCPHTSYPAASTSSNNEPLLARLLLRQTPFSFVAVAAATARSVVSRSPRATVAPAHHELVTALRRAFDSAAGRMSILACNDAWQPPLVFVAVQDGVQVLLVPSDSGESTFDTVADTRAYWRQITRFHASMFQCYVVCVNRLGGEAGIHYWGGSHVVGPWGAGGPGSGAGVMTMPQSEDRPQGRPEGPDREKAVDRRTGRSAARARIEHQASWVDQQVRVAMAKGEFDNLPGAGKPIRDLGGEHDLDWWVQEADRARADHRRAPAGARAAQGGRRARRRTRPGERREGGPRAARGLQPAGRRGSPAATRWRPGDHEDPRCGRRGVRLAAASYDATLSERPDHVSPGRLPTCRPCRPARVPPRSTPQPVPSPTCAARSAPAGTTGRPRR